MNFVSDLSREQWRSILAELPAPCRDVYFTPDYHYLHVANGDGHAYCSAARENSATLVVPAMKMAISRPVSLPGEDPVWDLQSCNGYGGPLASPGATKEFLEAAWAAWREECQQQRIVAAFFRLHPLLRNERFLPCGAHLREDRETVFLDLSCGAEKLWAQADSRYRNMVTKGRREGVQVIWNDPGAWEDLVTFYGSAMERLNAPDSLRFSPAYFCALRKLEFAELAIVRRGSELAAASVFLFGPKWCHYHLSARDPNAGNHLHSIILQSAIERAIERGVRGLHLGGGRTGARGDGLLRFKKSTGGRLQRFSVALVVVDNERYDALCKTWQEREGRRPTWLLGYRQPGLLGDMRY